MDKVFNNIYLNSIIYDTLFKLVEKDSILYSISTFRKEKDREFKILKLTTSLKDKFKNQQPRILEKSFLPIDSLEHLTLYSNFIIEKDVLPNTLKSISFNDDFNNINLNNLPRNLECIRFLGNTLVNYLPDIFSDSDDDDYNFDQLSNIDINNYSQNVLNYPELFPNLKSIKIDSINEDHPLDIPKSVTKIIFSNYFKYNIPTIQPHIKSITFGKNVKLDLNNIPLNIEFITIESFRKFKIQSFFQFKNLKEISYYSDKNDMLYNFVSDDTNRNNIYKKIKSVFPMINIIKFKKFNSNNNKFQETEIFFDR